MLGALSLFRSSNEEWTPLSPRSHYPSMPSYPNTTDHVLSYTTAVFSVVGMSCAACAGSVEKSIKRLPGIREAAVDLINNRSLVIFSPSFLNEETIREAIEDAGFEATLLTVTDELNDKSVQVCRIQIKGMTCTSCSSTIESALQAIQGVIEARVALATEEAQVHYNANVVNYNQILEAVQDTGFEASLISSGEDMFKIDLLVQGALDEHSMKLIKESLEVRPGVLGVEIHQEFNKISISYKPDMTGPRDFIKVIEETEPGNFKANIFPPEGGQRDAHRNEEIRQYYRSFLWSLMFTIPVFLTSMVLMYIPGIKHVLDTKVVNMLTLGEVVRWVLVTPVQFIIGRRFYSGSYKSLRRGSANMDVLIALGTNAAYFYSVYSVLRAATSKTFMGTDFFETSAMLISFILLGKYLEIVAKGKTSNAIAKLMNLTPDTAILLTLDNEGNVTGEEEIDSRLVQKNDVIKIIPGAKVASDGFVIWGQSHVNESMITGEARPVAKRKGDPVIGGTVNEKGVLRIKATRVGSESALSQIVRLVESAQMAKAPVQKFADRISKYFVPLVILTSIATWLAWFLAGKFHAYPKSWIPSSMDSFELALQFGISVMVIACPCALGLATPTAVMVGTGVGATQGVLIKGGQALESAHKVNCIVFDKTGTLTIGKPVVVSTKLLTNMVQREFYELVAAAEVNSEHPLAKAIVEYAKKFRDEENPAWPEARDFESITGHGVKAIVRSKEIIIGNKSLFVDQNVAIPIEAEDILAEAEGMAQTGILVSINGKVAGVLAVSDPLKPGAPEIISILKSMKIRSIMVTGDNLGTANSIAKEVGIESVIAEAKPEQKAKHVKDLQKERICEAIEDAGFQAKSIDEESNDTSSQICRIHIKGMTCTSCSSTIESALKTIHGVQKARVALATEEAEICYDPNIVSHNQLMETIEDAGFEAILISTGEHISKIEFKVHGILNDESISAIEHSLKALPGVETIDIYPHINKITITYKPYMTGPRTFIQVIESTGSGCFRAVIFPNEGGRETHRQEEIKRYFKFFIWSLALTIPVFLTSMVLMYIPGVKHVLDMKVVNMLNIGLLLRWEFSTPVQFIIGMRFYIGSYKALRKGSANMDVLIALGTNAAYFYSVYVVARAAFSKDFEGSDFFETSAMLISFILLGKYLEVLAKGKTSQAIAKLMDLTPDTATLLTQDDEGNVISEQQIDSRLIQKNDVIKIVPGAKVASDGLVMWGKSHINESMITGEARPVAKRKGDMVIGGTVNENGVLHVKVTRVGSESALSQIVRLVESAQMAKAPVQKLADHISKYFVPLVILLSLSTWLSWFLAGQLHAYPKSWIPSSMNSFELALQFGISVMVIACPCALGLATPTAVMVGTGVGATQGVLIKGGKALESAHKVSELHCI
ncbi:PREDICTED: probable copper-transporting ATPase HMA5 isoform X2 [Lupinus angustifolius]|uniref:probable copper-transporting ATPase HMA5 isoform X2 n=1 Tax=Lupinus angustifolius TaxID=3871 RepID=UPI00092EE9BB|nr:PREDICTED: probable copper-transporting ATPase HMA5 isoform X2 [Lupinus angustifolius]